MRDQIIAELVGGPRDGQTILESKLPKIKNRLYITAHGRFDILSQKPTGIYLCYIRKGAIIENKNSRYRYTYDGTYDETTQPHQES
jgi:hypothetical protein